MSTIIGLAIFGVMIIVALFLARLAFTIVIVVIAGLIQGIVWVGKAVFVRNK